jgi:hypothetical protein
LAWARGFARDTPGRVSKVLDFGCWRWMLAMSGRNGNGNGIFGGPATTVTEP